MNLKRLYQILNITTVQLRKGPEVTQENVGPLEVIHVYDMPHESEALSHVEKIDLEMLVIGVDRKEAEAYKNELIGILNTYPEPDRLAGGPSYIEVGAAIGDQGAAFQLFALGKVLGLWDVITPATFGMTGEEARKAAGSGFVMITGYKKGGN